MRWNACILFLTLRVMLTHASVLNVGNPSRGRRIGGFLFPFDDYYDEEISYGPLMHEKHSKSSPEPSPAPCKYLHQDWYWMSLTKGELYEEQTLSLSLLWDESLGRAAAALLRATLIAAGYNPDEIKLYQRDKDPSYHTSRKHSLSVEVTMPARLHVRLTSRAASSLFCTANITWALNETYETLSKCDFVTPGLQKKDHVIVYILNEWESTCTAEFIKYFDATGFTKQLDILYLDRSQLNYFIRESPRSFFFLDTDHWGELPHVLLAQLPPKYDSDGKCTQNETVSLNANNEFSSLLSQALFTPSLADLRNVTQLSEKNQSMEDAACQFALQNSEEFKAWRKAVLVKPTRRTVAVLICKTEEQDLNEYLYILRLSSENIFGAIYDDSIEVQIQVFYIDCFDTDWLLRKLLNWFSKKVVSQKAGVVLPDDMAIAAAPLADKFQLPLITYDMSSSESVVRSATGRLEHLELAIRRLLTNCGWQRIAVLSEPTRLAAKISALLRLPSNGLVVRDVNVTSAQETKRALRDLLNLNTRVFLVNAGAAMTATILAIAKELDITRDKGFTWIMREYYAADNATAAIRPYSVSFWWRGGTEKSDQRTKKNVNEIKEMENMAESEEAHKTFEEKDASGWGYDDHDSFESSEYYDDNFMFAEQLRKKFETRWHNRPWPLHAAPLQDALLTLAEGFKRLSSYRSTWFDARSDGALRKFWDGIQQNNISGIVNNLVYDDHGVLAPLVFVEQWGEEPRPQLLATWQSGHWRELDEACPTIEPPDDGSIHCLVGVGDPFQPRCKDAVWIISTAIVGIVSVVLIVAGIKRSRQALTARDHRIKTEFAKRLLARRERVFAALAAHLVDRSTLELHQELGTGRFGRVHLGVLRGSGKKHKNIVVAAKTLKEEAAPAEESEFLREACMLAALNHEHIINFVGVCVVDGPPMLLMGHAFFGDLLRYLQNRRYLISGITSTETVCNWVGREEKTYVSPEALTRLAHEAAEALAYIAQRGIVHRDVRASNCLIDERRSLKLADFGLARATGTVDGEYACRRGLLPVLWMAPESLATGVSMAASDVWAFGVLVFELVTLGRRPYGSKPPSSVLQHVLAGGQPQLPWDVSAETRALMRACWRRAPESRPTAARLAEWLSNRWRALRPALVTELVDIDSEVFGNSEFSETNFDTPYSEVVMHLVTSAASN